MPQLDNPRHERFCQLVAKGAYYQAAYGEVYDKSGKSAANMGSKLLEDIGIRNRVKELQAEGASDTVLTIAAANKYCLDVVTTPVGEVDETSPLCQQYEITPEKTKYRMPDKLRAIELTMKLQGKLREGNAAPAPAVNVNITLPRSLLDAIQEQRRLSLVGGNS